MSRVTVDPGADLKARVAGDGFAAEVLVSPFNQRLQVLDYTGPKLAALVSDLVADARRRGFGKIFLKAAAADRPTLEAAGMVEEASIWGYFPDGEDAAVMARFLEPSRREQPHDEQQAAILDAIRERPPDSSVPVLPEGYSMAVAEPGDGEELAALYAEVFASYPFPITEPQYLVDTMSSHVVYRLVRDASGAVVAAASGETDPVCRNAEMTDFATLPSQRGLGLAQHLLAALEKDMEARDIDALYTVARARSAGMNRVFYNRGYRRTGTLVNNCHIAGRFEDMHVWCRPHPGD